MADNPHIRLIVGADEGLSFSAMKSGLSNVIKRINEEPPKVKIKLDETSITAMQKDIEKRLKDTEFKAKLGLSFDSNTFKDFKDTVTTALTDIKKQVDEISGKNLGINLHISDANTTQEQIAGIRAQVMEYARALEQAQSVVVDLNNRGLKGALAAQGADLGKAVGVMVNYRTELTRIIESIDKQNTLTGLKIRINDLEQLRAAIVPVLDAANRLGATQFDMSKLIPTELPAKLETSMDKVSALMSTMTGRDAAENARQQAQAIEETVRAVQDEVQKIAASSRKYEEHKVSVDAAAKAEAEKAKASANVTSELDKEEAATDRASKSAKKHSEAYLDAKSKIEAYYKALMALDKNSAARDAIRLGDKGWETSSSSYAGLTAELNRLQTAFDLVTSSEAKEKMEASERVQINELLASKAREYALVVEENANKRAAAEEKAAEAAAKASEKEAAAKEKAAERAKKAAEQQTEAEKREATQRSKTLAQAESLLQRVQKAQQEWSAAQKNGATATEYAKLSEYERNLQGIIDALQNGAPMTVDMRAKIASLNAEFAHSTTVIKGSGSAIRSYFSTGLNTLSSRLTYTFGLASIVMKSVAEVKKMISTAVELDTAMNQLQVVTRGSGEEMEAYGRRVSQMAKDTAQATKDLIDATTVYARLGYTMDESAMLAKYTAQLQNVGDIEASAAQDAMTAVIKAFNIKVDEIETVMDKFVTVGNNFPISVSQIAEGMNNAGSMLSVAGNTLDESIALLTASNTTVQNISKASTGLRTIAARIRKNFDDLDALGESLDNEKYKEMVEILSGKGMKLTNANNEFRSTYDILKDIASVWDELTTMQQNTIVEVIAGTRQQNVFASVITQFQEAEKAMASMQNSAGALSESYSVYMNSIEAHTNIMKAAYAELSTAFLNSDFAKEGIDFLTSVLELLTAIVDPLSKIVGFIGPLGTALTAGGIGLFIKNLGQPYEGCFIPRS